MLDCFAPADTPDALPIEVVAKGGFEAWLKAQPSRIRNWLEGGGFEPRPGRSAFLPAKDGRPAGALLIASDPPEPWDLAGLQSRLPAGTWRLADDAVIGADQAALGFALQSYRFERYKSRNGKLCRLALPGTPAVTRAGRLAEAIYLARDLINTPASDMGPEDLAAAVEDVGRRFDASYQTIIGDDLIGANYPAIHAVGRGSARAPRLLDLRWGDAGPRVTLVGKGVCFDTGGLDLKTSSGMRLMKKDMGGAAITLALAQAIMASGLEVRLRLLIGAVENAVSGASMRPGDVLQTRKGLTVEVGNTDAEGRLVLADLLAEADAEQPDLLIDCATLTGAARVALGPDLPALFTPDDTLADDLLAAGRDAFDPLWRLPLHPPYREMIEPRIADLCNTGSGPHAGAITAALFLQAFVERTRAWAHLDLFAWNPSDRPGRPKGGEASALRALFGLIERRLER
jgi:leucyl aminopeptidase